MKTNRTWAYKVVAIAFGVLFSASVMAADPPAGATKTTKEEYKAALATAKANYKAAYSACPADAGADRLKCRRQAHADWDKAKADAREAHGLERYASGPRN